MSELLDKIDQAKEAISSGLNKEALALLSESRKLLSKQVSQENINFIRGNPVGGDDVVKYIHDVSSHCPYASTFPEMSELVAVFGVSEQTIRRRLADTAYGSYRGIKQSIRIQMIKNLMVSRCFGYEEMADLSGFHDRPAFFRFFKSSEGMTPSEWMEEHANVFDTTGQ